MGVIRSVGKFVLGGISGAAVGATAAMLVAPDSGPELQRKLRARLHAAKMAGVEAQAAKENELIRKYRLTVNDTGALKDSEEQASKERAESIAALASPAK